MFIIQMVDRVVRVVVVFLVCLNVLQNLQMATCIVAKLINLPYLIKMNTGSLNALKIAVNGVKYSCHVISIISLTNAGVCEITKKKTSIKKPTLAVFRLSQDGLRVYQGFYT